jgi:L-threonylcarbamoyladenylate synthase
MSADDIKRGGGTAGGIAPAEEASITRAANILRTGGLIAFPTETVYGLGADATNDRAVAAIFEAKGRPRFNPLIVHLPNFEQATNCVQINELARAAAERFWPGPLTLVLPRRADTHISYLCSAGLDSLAVRVPGHPVAQDLLAAVGRPLAAPSANASGGVSPTTAAHVADSLDGRVDLILDGGSCTVGLESSVLDLTGGRPLLLRPGGIPKEELEGTLGSIEEAIEEDSSQEDAPRSPGRLASHYAPGQPLRLEAREVNPDEALLAFGPAPPAGARTTLNLSQRGNLVEAAANLFAMLHALDDPRHAAIAVMPIPERGLGAAINDRLRRAAEPRR